MTASRWRPSTAGPRGCSFRTCTSGRAPNGCAGSGSGTPTSRVSGRPTATTCTETHGGNSGTRAIDLADHHGLLGQGRDGIGADDPAVPDHGRQLGPGPAAVLLAQLGGRDLPGRAVAACAWRRGDPHADPVPPGRLDRV